MTTLLLVIQIIACIAMIVIVMMQRSKGEGLGSIGGGAQLFFDKSTSFDRVLDKATIVIGVVLFVNTMILAIVS